MIGGFWSSDGAAVGGADERARGVRQKNTDAIFPNFSDIVRHISD
jgi:hypothetical protein